MRPTPRLRITPLTRIFDVRLKYEDCIPDVELKKKIDAWIAEGNQPSNINESVSMDVDEVANRAE